MTKLRLQHGFTLIELLAVTALIGLLAGMTITRYAKMGTQTVLANQARQVYMAAKYARIAAVEKQMSFVLKLDENGRQIVVSPIPREQTAAMETSGLSATAGTQVSATQEVLQPESEIVRNAYVKPVVLDDKLLVEQFLVDGQNSVQTQCEFYPDGSAQACVIQLGDGLRHASVFITQTGRAQLKMEAAQQIQTGRVDLDILE